jgi:uncharacterized membrane protein YqaE (UPF0057 family)
MGTLGVTRVLPETRGGVLSVDILRIVLAIILPPLGVFLQVGLTKHFWINVLLSIFLVSETAAHTPR